MKKIFFTCFAAILLAGAATRDVYSQDFFISGIAKFTPPAALKNNSSSLHPGLKRSSGPLFLNEVASKAIRDFTKRYKNVHEAKWFRLTDGTDGFVVCFTTEGIKIRIIYDKKGNYDCMFRDYFEDKLPWDIRHRVKTIYYDFNIFHITEVGMNNKTVYVIMLEDKNSWKRIVVADGVEIAVMEEISKR